MISLVQMIVLVSSLISNLRIKHRHIGLNLIFTTQNPKSIPNIIRNNIRGIQEEDYSLLMIDFRGCDPLFGPKRNVKVDTEIKGNRL